MNKLKLFLGRIVAAVVAFAVILVTLPLTLMLASITLIVGALAAFHFRRQMRQASEQSRAAGSSDADTDSRARRAGNWFNVASTQGVVIDQVKVNGVWQMQQALDAGYRGPGRR